MAEMLSISLLGAPQILINQQPVPLNRRKSRALVYYLAAQNQAIPREQLLALFWPESDRSSAQQTLRTLIHGLRQALGPALKVNSSTVFLDAEVDVRFFQEVLDRPMGKPINDPQLLSSRLSLYRGDFLAGFSLPDSDEFNQWATQQQELYRRLAVRGLTALSRLYVEQSDYPSALNALERALQLDPLQEDLQRDLLRLLYQSGDRASAIRHYDAFRKQLDEELGVPPMPETRALYDRILADPPAGLIPTVFTPAPTSTVFHLHPAPNRAVLSFENEIPFTGRQVELRQIQTGISNGHLVLLEGEPGVGKTRLVEEYLRQQGGLTLTSTAHELEQALPFQPWRGALRSLLHTPQWPTLQRQIRLPKVWQNEVYRLLPELEDGTPSTLGDTLADESRLWEGLRQFFNALSALIPVTIFLDDLHWADSASLGLLGYLLRQRPAAADRLAFLAASHPIHANTALGKFMAALRRENLLTSLTPPRLTTAEIQAIAYSLSPTDSQTLAEWLERNSEGNAYFLVELIRLARSQNILQQDGRAHLPLQTEALVVPQNVYSLIETRLARLSSPAHQVLDAAVAAGREFETEVVLEASGLPEEAALQAMEELEAARIIRPASPDGRTYAFDHSLIMEVAYREAGEARHRRFHRHIAEALEKIYAGQLDSVAGLLASHFEEGNAPFKAAPYARRAAALAENLAAWNEAISFYRQALQDQIDAQDCIPTWLALGNIYYQTGDIALAAEAAQNALDLAYEIGDVSWQNQARLALAQFYLPQARLSEAIDLAQQVLMSGLSADFADAEFLWGTALSIGGADLDGASQHLDRAAHHCESSPHPPDRLMRIRFEQGSVAAQRGQLEQAIALYHDSLAAAQHSTRSDRFQWLVLSCNNLAYHLHLLKDPQAERYALEGLKVAQEKGILSLQTYLLSTLGEISMDHNQLDQADTYFQTGLELAQKFGMTERKAGFTANLGRLAALRGEKAQALQLLQDALQQVDSIQAQNLAVRIRLWLAPLLPRSEGLLLLNQAQTIVPPESSQLIAQIQQAETDLQQTRS